MYDTVFPDLDLSTPNTSKCTHASFLNKVYHLVPFFDIGKRRGFSDYIDFLRYDELPYPVVKGIDIYKRPFIAIKVIVGPNNIPEDLHNKEVLTIFQRYSDDTSFWVSNTCGNVGLGSLDLTEEKYNMIKEILTFGNVHNYKFDSEWFNKIIKN